MSRSGNPKGWLIAAVPGFSRLSHPENKELAMIYIQSVDKHEWGRLDRICTAG